MTKLQLTPTQGILVAIDIGKTRNEVLIEIPGHARRRRLTVLNTRAEYDRLIDLLSGLGQPVTCASLGSFLSQPLWSASRVRASAREEISRIVKPAWRRRQARGRW